MKVSGKGDLALSERISKDTGESEKFSLDNKLESSVGPQEEEITQPQESEEFVKNFASNKSKIIDPNYRIQQLKD